MGEFPSDCIFNAAGEISEVVEAFEEPATGHRSSAYLSFEGVELGVGEEAELEGEVFSDEESPDDPDSAGLC
jgi:hypothetical protein